MSGLKKYLAKLIDCLLIAAFAAMGCALGVKIWEVLL